MSQQLAFDIELPGVKRKRDPKPKLGVAELVVGVAVGTQGELEAMP